MPAAWGVGTVHGRLLPGWAAGRSGLVARRVSGGYVGREARYFLLRRPRAEESWSAGEVDKEASAWL